MWFFGSLAAMLVGTFLLALLVSYVQIKFGYVPVEPWVPKSPTARSLLRAARRESWSYERFRFFFDAAVVAEREYEASLSSKAL